MSSKEFKVRANPLRPMCYEVYLEGGGEVPKNLKGLYTSPTEAKKDIDHHLETRRVYNRTAAKKSVKSKEA